MNRTLKEKREQPATEERSIGKNSWLVAPGVYRLKDIFVNVYILQNHDATEWVLVDTGLKSTGEKVKSLVKEIFGSAGSKPQAIIMTHGHFDHRGSLMQLAEEWEVPVYCHHKEKPYLTGIASYPPADPFAGGGAMSLFSFAYPKGPINVEWYLKELEMDPAINGQMEQGPVPKLEDWRWISTPGHTAGHISLFRDKDGVLIAGDAIVTTMSESVLALASQRKNISGPPKYFTPDWGSATQSVKNLAALHPNVIATGHGPSMYGLIARKELNKLVREFWRLGLPASGRYIKEPAEFDENGIPVHVPKSDNSMLKKVAFAAGILVLGIVFYKQRKILSGLSMILTKRLGKTLMRSTSGALLASIPDKPVRQRKMSDVRHFNLNSIRTIFFT